jgi:hypothetical protein
MLLYREFGSQIVTNNYVTPSTIAGANGGELTFFDKSTGIQDGLLRLYQNIAGIPTRIIEVIGNDLQSNYNIRAQHLVGNTNSPSISASTGAGTSPTISLTGNDIAGVITLTTGSSPAGSNALIATISFNQAYTVAPAVVLSPGNRNACLLTGTNQVLVPENGQTNGVSTSAFRIESGSTALSASTPYVWRYHIIQ